MPLPPQLATRTGGLRRFWPHTNIQEETLPMQDHEKIGEEEVPVGGGENMFFSLKMFFGLVLALSLGVALTNHDCTYGLI
jgi:hypothetical protein